MENIRNDVFIFIRNIKGGVGIRRYGIFVLQIGLFFWDIPEGAVLQNTFIYGKQRESN